MGTTPRKTRTVKAASAKDADPLNNAECLAELVEDARVADLELERGPDSSGWRHNETLRPAINDRAAFFRALLKLPELAKYLACLLLCFAFVLPTRAENVSLSGNPQTGDSQQQLEARTAMVLTNFMNSGISLSSSAKVRLWDGTSALTINTDGSLNVAVLSSTLPTGAATAANQATMQARLDTIAANTTPAAAVTNAYRNLTATGTIVLKSGAGVLHTVTINSLGTVASVVTLYDNTAASGAKIGTINSLTLGGSMVYDVAFNTGLTVATTGVVAPDITVSYR